MEFLILIAAIAMAAAMFFRAIRIIDELFTKMVNDALKENPPQ